MTKSILTVIGLLTAMVWLGSGCAHLVVKNDGTVADQDHAIHIVWKDVYGRTDEHPGVRWVHGSDLDCIDPVSGKPGFGVVLITGAACREGVTYVPWLVEVAWSGKDKLSGTVLAHELMHAAQLRDAIIDPNHKTAPFLPGGLVDMANTELKLKGL